MTTVLTVVIPGPHTRYIRSDYDGGVVHCTILSSTFLLIIHCMSPAYTDNPLSSFIGRSLTAVTV